MLFSCFTKKRKFEKYVILLLLIFLFTSTAFSKRSDSSFEIKSLSILKDKNRLYEIANLPFGYFSPLNTTEPNFGLYDGVVWFRLNTGDLSKEKWVLEFKNPLLDEIELFTFSGDAWISKGKLGDQVRTSQNKGRFLHFDVKSNQEILLKVNNLGDEFLVPMQLLTKVKLQNRNLWEQFYLGIYFGIILFVIVANLFVLGLLREKTNLYYFGYLFSIILLQLSIVGFGNAYIWSNQPFFANCAPPLFGSLAIFFSILFSQTILRMKKILPKGYKILSFFAVLALANICFSLIPYNVFYKIAGTAVNILSLVTALVLILSGLLSYQKGYKPARFFLLGFFLFFIFICVFVLKNFGFLPKNFLTEYSLLFGSFFEIVCLTFALIDTFGLHKQKTLKTLVEINKLQVEQNANLERGVQQRTIEIQQKNVELELKSKEILDSIHYAKLIQNGMMQTEENISNFLDESFVLFRPKDIVSGDFYWLTELNIKSEGNSLNKYQVLCLADCTGHGVPGAIISVLGLRILNDVIKRKDIGSPSEALNALNEELIGIFGNVNSSEAINNGMDAVVCSINKQEMKLQFSGAKNDLYLVRNGKIEKFSGDRQSIGQSSGISKFKLHEIDLEKGDCIYLTTDGYVDQFGGLKNKKMKFTFLRDFISMKNHIPMGEQKKLIAKNLDDWIGEGGEQTDDICVIGFRI